MSRFELFTEPTSQVRRIFRSIGLKEAQDFVFLFPFLPFTQEVGKVPLAVVFLTMDDKSGGYILLSLPKL